jgi:hypothetical protein
LDQVAVELPDRAPLFAMPLGLAKQPTDQGMLVMIEPGWALARGIAWFHHAAGQILADCITGQSCSSRNLSNRHPLTEMPSLDNTQ